MKPIRCAVLLLAALMVFSGTAQAKKIVTVRRGQSSAQRRRDEQRRQQKLREQRDREIKALKKRREQYAAAVKKQKSEAEARERERKDAAKAAILKKEQEKTAAAKAAAAEKALLGEYDMMAREVRMSSVQRGKLVDLVTQLRGGPKAAKTPANQAEIARLVKLHAAAKGAKKGLIAEALKRARAKKPPPAKAKAKPGPSTPAEYHRKIMGLLSTTQKRKWGGYKLARDPLLTFKDIKLTEKQIKRIRVICDAAAKDLADEAADIDPKVAAEKRRSVLKGIRTQIIYEVMTPDQRAAAGGK